MNKNTTMATLKSFEELKCWQSCRRFRLFVRDLLKAFPKQELYLMTAQLKRSSRSTTHNIAEGFGRDNALDNARFCRTSRGSLMEALDQLIACHDEELITSDELEKGRALFTEARALLEGYIDYLNRAKGDNVLREPVACYGATTDGIESADMGTTTPNTPTPNRSTPNRSTSNPQPATT